MITIVAVGTKRRLLRAVEETNAEIVVEIGIVTVSAAVDTITQKITRTKVERTQQIAAVLVVVMTIEEEITETEMMHLPSFRGLVAMIIMVATALHPLTVVILHYQILHLHL